MSASALCFVDTNVLLHLFAEDAHKADRAERLLAKKPLVSIQVLSEFTSVARREWNVAWHQIDDILATIRTVCRIESLSLETYLEARRLAERYGMAWYDAMIAASAMLAGCTTLYTEDFQHGQLFERKLRVINPFVS